MNIWESGLKMQTKILSSNEDSLSDRFDKTDEQIANLTEALAAEKKAKNQERFCWILGVFIWTDFLILKDWSWCGQLLIFALEIFALMVAAKLLGQEFAIKWLSDIQEKIRLPGTTENPGKN